jgi:ATP phosphoribosyltransferase
MAPVPDRRSRRRGPERAALTFALPKGRILDQAKPLLAAAGFDLEPGLGEIGRKLLFELSSGDRVLLVKPTDVPTYVERGVADFGIAGTDTLREQGRDLYEPVDLGIGRCRMAVAQNRAAEPRAQRGADLVVATKYPRCALRHYRAKGIQPDIIPLFGSVELGPITGLADQIVDLVESGETLRQNDLVEIETIFEVSSRLIVNGASLRLKHAAVSRTIDALRDAVEERSHTRERAANS